MRFITLLKIITISLLAALAVVAALGSGMLWTWRHFGPQKPPLSAARKAVANSVIAEAVETLHTHRGSRKSVAVFPLENDPTGYVSHQLRTALAADGHYRVTDLPMDQKVRSWLGLPLQAPKTLGRAFNVAYGTGVDSIVTGGIESFESSATNAVLHMEIILADLESRTQIMRWKHPGGVVETKTPAEKLVSSNGETRATAAVPHVAGLSIPTARETERDISPKSDKSAAPSGFVQQPEAAQEQPAADESNDSAPKAEDKLPPPPEPSKSAIGSSVPAVSPWRLGLFQRLGLWTLSVLMLPVLGMPFVRAMVRRESNGSNAFALVTLGLINTLTLVLIFGTQSFGISSLLLAGILLIAAASYNITLMTLALRAALTPRVLSEQN